MAKSGKRKAAPGDVASNRQASFRYAFLEKVEAGMVLTGTEVKSLRTVGAQLKDGYATVQDGELWLHNIHIPPYPPAANSNHDPDRPRKLLLKRSEIAKLSVQVAERGLTLVPTRIYFSNRMAKVEIALARGKDQYDKRQSLKEKDSKREMARALREVNR
jgi:SsrA-binding protein